MPSSIRPKGSGSTSRPSPVTPMSERQQLALLMQMTSNNNEGRSRSPSSNLSRSRDRNERGETPLHLAAMKGDIEQVSKLLAHRADPNVADFAGWTPLHEACSHGCYEVALRLLQSGANVNARGLDNDTPLHDAAANGHVKIAKLLVERGADINAKNSKGKTPLDVALPTVRPYLLNPSLSLPESASISRGLQPRLRDDKKVSNLGDSIGNKLQKDEPMDTKCSSSGATTNADDIYEFKSLKESIGESADRKTSPDGELDSDKKSSDGGNVSSTDCVGVTGQTQHSEDSNAGAVKRYFTELNETSEENNAGNTGAGVDEESRRKKRKDETGKEGKSTPQRNISQLKGQNKQLGANQNKGTLNASKSGVDKKSPCSSPKPAVPESENEEGKSDLKVPPLKIVIPQTSNNEQEAGPGRNGKGSSQRTHQALPYIVATSNSNEVFEKEQSSSSATTASESTNNVKTDEKKETPTVTQDEAQQNNDTEAAATAPTSTASTSTSAPVELHPRKRKMKQNKEQATAQPDTVEAPAETQVHPHEQPITNCYKLFLDIRKQIAKRRKGFVPVQPKPPQGFKDYLMNRCTYVLAKNAPTTPNINYPQTLPPQMKDLFTEQEKDRYKLRTKHVIEKEKLVLSVEQEILRVHGRAARALANQSSPFSVCTILKDEEVYNLITPEQEEKDRHARSRYNGRLFLSWLQDVDDKWEKIKEHMLLRHHREAESLHALQKMNWQWKMIELNFCDRKSTPTIDELHVPIVHVSDDFDLLPA